MANYNKIIMIGNLTRDPQLSYLPSNTPAVEFGLACNRKWKDQSGQQREDTCFVDCRAYGRSAEILNQYTAKGRQILVEGRLQFDTWEGKDGSRHSKHRIFVENFQFLDSGSGRGQGGQGQSQGQSQSGQGQSGYQQAPPRQARQAPQSPQQQSPPMMDEPPQPYDGNDGGGDDIPF